MLKVKLTQSEMYFLENFSSYKSFARRENFSCRYALERYMKKNGTPLIETWEQLETSLIEKKVLSKSKNGALRCKLDYYETKALIAYQTDTKESLLNAIESQKETIVKQTTHIETMPNLSWPYDGQKNAERDYLKSNKEELSRLETRLSNLD